MMHTRHTWPCIIKNENNIYCEKKFNLESLSSNSLIIIDLNLDLFDKNIRKSHDLIYNKNIQTSYDLFDKNLQTSYDLVDKNILEFCDLNDKNTQTSYDLIHNLNDKNTQTSYSLVKVSISVEIITSNNPKDSLWEKIKFMLKQCF